MTAVPFFDQLAGGDRRSTGKSNQAAKAVLSQPERLQELLDCAMASDPIVRSRSTHALMQIAASQPELLQMHIQFLLDHVAMIQQWEVRSHICQCLTKLKPSPKQISEFLKVLEHYLEDKSSIVKTCAMQALVDLCQLDASLLKWVRPLILDCTHHGTAAMRARGRHLLKKLDREFT